MRWLERIYRVTRGAIAQFIDDGAMQLGAALAFYSALSVAPLIVLFMALAGYLGSEATVHREIVGEIDRLIGPQGAEVVETVIEESREPGRGAAALFGLGVLAFGATTVFAQLQFALNTVWRVRSRPERGWLRLLRVRLLSLGLVVVLGFLMLVSLVGSSVLAYLAGRFRPGLPGSDFVWALANNVVSILVFGTLFALVFMVLPDVQIAWRDVWQGALLTALLFAGGKELIGLYLGHSSVASSYGAAGSFVVLLLWIYYASLILLLGAEFTQVRAKLRGKPIRPSPQAEAIDDSRTDPAEGESSRARSD